MKCIKCESSSSIIGKIISTNGAIQVREVCLECGTNQRGNGKNIPHSDVPNLDDLPILDDYRAYAIPCEVIGCICCETECHHWAPRHLFREECEYWPHSYLCKKHHAQWHRIVTPNMAGIQANE